MTRRNIFSTFSAAFAAVTASLFGKAKTASSQKDARSKSVSSSQGFQVACHHYGTDGKWYALAIAVVDRDMDLTQEEWSALPSLLLTGPQIKKYAEYFKEIGKRYDESVEEHGLLV